MWQGNRSGFRWLLLLAFLPLEPLTASTGEKNLLDHGGEVTAPPPVQVAPV